MKNILKCIKKGNGNGNGNVMNSQEQRQFRTSFRTRGGISYTNYKKLFL